MSTSSSRPPAGWCCACGACAVLFSGQAGTRFKRVPRRVRGLNDFRLTEAQWEGLRLPIDLAFFFDSTPHGRTIACYPSPAGATESLLDLETWDEIRRENPVLESLAPDVEALLVNRADARRRDRGGSGPIPRADRPVLPAGGR